MKHAANIVTASRIVASIVMLVAPADYALLWALYAWCGTSDMLDGLMARRFGASTFGARLDSAADLAFVVACLVRIAPSLPWEPWLMLWVAVIGLVKIGAYLVARSQKRVSDLHSAANKFTGLLVFATLPLMALSGAAITAIPACMMATFAATQEACSYRKEKLA